MKPPRHVDCDRCDDLGPPPKDRLRFVFRCPQCGVWGPLPLWPVRALAHAAWDVGVFAVVFGQTMYGTMLVVLAAAGGLFLNFFE